MSKIFAIRSTQAFTRFFDASATIVWDSESQRKYPKKELYHRGEKIDEHVLQNMQSSGICKNLAHYNFSRLGMIDSPTMLFYWNEGNYFGKKVFEILDAANILYKPNWIYLDGNPSMAFCLPKQSECDPAVAINREKWSIANFVGTYYDRLLINDVLWFSSKNYYNFASFYQELSQDSLQCAILAKVFFMLHLETLQSLETTKFLTAADLIISSERQKGKEPPNKEKLIGVLQYLYDKIRQKFSSPC